MEVMVSKESVLEAMDEEEFWRKELPELTPDKDDQAPATCPFCARRMFYVNFDTGQWTCFCAPVKSDVFQFMARRYGVTLEDAVRKIAREVGLLPTDPSEQRKILEVFPYTDKAGREAFLLHWNKGKRYTWALDRKGQQPGRGDCEPLLYNLAQVTNSQEIVVVGDEHDADGLNGLLREAGMKTPVVTCFPGEIDAACVTPLHGKERVWMTCYNDEAGHQSKDHVVELLRQKVGDLLTLNLPTEGTYWTGWIEQGGTADAFQSLLKEAILVQQFPWVTSKDITSGQRQDTKWLIDGILPRGTVVLMSGREGSMKSWLALDWALAVSEGREWLGRRSQTGSVLYLDAEMPLDLFAQRISDMEASSSSRFHVMSWQKGDEFPSALDAPLLQHAAKWHALIVIDTMRRFMGPLKENSCDDMAVLTHAAKQLTRHGATILLLHHAVKDVEKEGYLGSTEIGAGCDVVLHVKKWDNESTHKLKVSTQKTRYSQGTELVLMTQRDLPAPIFEVKSAQAEQEAKMLKLRQLIVEHDVRGGVPRTKAKWSSSPSISAGGKRFSGCYMGGMGCTGSQRLMANNTCITHCLFVHLSP